MDYGSNSPDPSDLLPVKKFIESSLSQKLKGNSTQYNMIIKQMKSCEDADMLWKILICLQSSTSVLTQSSDVFRDLLGSIFSYDWKQEFKISMEYIKLVKALVFSNATYLTPAFRFLVKSLLPPMTTSLSSESVDQNIQLRRDLIHECIRNIVAHVPTGNSILYPILCDHFPHKRFSRNVQKEYVSQLLTICEYLPSIQPKILDLIITKCLEIDVEIVIEDSGEVKIQEDYNGEALDDGMDIFQLDEEVPSHQDPDRVRQQKKLTDKNSHARIPIEVAEMADKLDSILTLLIDFIGSRAQASAPLIDRQSPTEVTEKLFHQMFSIFKSRVLPTHKSKFVQFSLFYLVSQSESLSKFFCQSLTHLSFDSTLSSLIRSTSIMYLASYLSRSTCVPREFISETIKQLLVWGASYVLSRHASHPKLKSDVHLQFLMNRQSMDGSFPRLGHNDKPMVSLNKSKSLSSFSPAAYQLVAEQEEEREEYEFDEFGRRQLVANTFEKHEFFYYLVQSLCYILCFHGVDLANEQKSSTALKSYWETIITSRFDPLRYCLKSIRIEFIKLAIKTEFFGDDCWDALGPDLIYMDALQKAGKPPAASCDSTTVTMTTTECMSTVGLDLSKGGTSSFMANPASSGRVIVTVLDSFFPFDPCLLSSVHQRIHSVYRIWEGVPGLDEDEDEDLVDDRDEDTGANALLRIKQRRQSTQEEDSNSQLESMISSINSSIVSSLALTDNMSMSVSSSLPREINQHFYNKGQAYPPANLASLKMSASNSPSFPSSTHAAAMVANEPLRPNNESYNAHYFEETQFQINQESHSELKNESHFRRSRRYSIGSNGSW